MTIDPSMVGCIIFIWSVVCFSAGYALGAWTAYKQACIDHNILTGKNAKEFRRRFEENNRKSGGGTMLCKKAPEGWLCNRGEGHEGPCAAMPLFDIFSLEEEPVRKDKHD